MNIPKKEEEAIMPICHVIAFDNNWGTLLKPAVNIF
jgi:hypothetical protein